MDNAAANELCHSLITADSEQAVIDLLADAGFWEHESAWRYYGDYENNYNTIGNQQSRPDAALVEKLVNSVDARLMNECLVRRIDPEGTEAPQSIVEAVATFFEPGSDPKSLIAGRISKPAEKFTSLVRKIAVIVSGTGVCQVPQIRGTRGLFLFKRCAPLSNGALVVN